MAESKKTHWRTPDKTDYLGAVDVDEINGGGEIKAIIKEVKIEEAKVRGQEGIFRVAYFHEDLKPMILNVTNSKCLKKVVNSEYVEDWTNLEVILYIKKNVRMGAETSDALRIKSAKKYEKKAKVPKAITDGRLDKAIEAMSKGSVTADQIKRGYKLTASQLKKLEDASNEK